MLSPNPSNHLLRLLDVFWTVKMKNGNVFKHLPYARRLIAEQKSKCVSISAKAIDNLFELTFPNFRLNVNGLVLLWPVIKPYGRWDLIAEKKFVKHFDIRKADSLVEVRFGIACEHKDEILRQYICISPSTGKYKWFVEKTEIDITKVVV